VALPPHTPAAARSELRVEPQKRDDVVHALNAELVEGPGSEDLGFVISLTVIGAIIGIPLILVGLLGVAAGLISGSGGVPFAVLFGVGTGFVYYRYRMRALLRSTRPI
jgi:hypothetical protein